jgi:hypothetical protein
MRRAGHQDGAGARCAAVCSGPLGSVRGAPVSVPLVGLGVKLMVFGSAAVPLYASGYRVLAIALVLLVLVNGVLVRL